MTAPGERKAILDVLPRGINFPPVIRTFRGKAVRVYFATGKAGGLSVQNAARRWSIRVTGNWRMTFGWDGVDAIDLDLEDDHR